MREAGIDAWVEGIGVRGPGLAGWPATRDVLVGTTPYASAPTVLTAPAALPPAERRRVGKGVKLSLEVGFEAAAHAARDPAGLISVFTSSSGDGDNCDAICRALAGDRLISPTRFHNSVHNAPSGYWGIASRSRASSTSLCAYDASFAAGLLDAVGHLADGADAVLLVAYDAPYPAPLFAARPVPDAFGVGLVLAREKSDRSIARLSLASVSRNDARSTESVIVDEALDACRRAIPAARALPLLAAIAQSRVDEHVLVDDVHDRLLALRVDAATRAGAERSPDLRCA